MMKSVCNAVLLAACCAFAVTQPACGPEACDEDNRKAGLVVVPLSDTDGTVVCDATVSFNGVPGFPRNDCTHLYQNTELQPLTITVSAPRFESETVEYSPENRVDGCGKPISERLEVTLRPN